jgi:hypothetical protein
VAVVIVIGVDPGGTTGIAVLELVNGRYVLLHSAEVPGAQFTEYLGNLVNGMLATGTLEADTGPALFNGGTVVTGITPGALLVATEQFVVRGRASRSKTPKGGALARRIIGWLESVVASNGGARLSVRSASQVKKWATNRRLERAGLLAAIPAGGGHARDAGRHALFAARMDLKWPDPLSATYPK